MKTLEKIMEGWENFLNADHELETRNKNPQSTIEGRTIVQLEVTKYPPYMVDVKNGKFRVTKGTAIKPLLCWKVPGDIFKSVMLGEHKLMFSLLDPRNALLFDSPHFTHWNGATIIETLLLAQEMVGSNPEFFNLVKELEC